MRLSVAALLVTCLGACAARGPAPQLTAELGKGDTLLHAGCYRCLEEALAIYERVAAATRAPNEARLRAFEAALLLAVRAKELGVPAEPLVARARALAEALPHPEPPAIPPARLVDGAEYFIGELSGFDPEGRQQRSRRPAPVNVNDPNSNPVRAAIQPADTNIVAQYILLAIDCEDPRLRKQVNAEAVLARHGNVPLLQFRMALCAMGPDYLTPLRQNDPRWADTLFTEGRRFISQRPEGDVLKAAQSYAAAHDAFPTSDAIRMALANAQSALAEHEPALANFDAVLAGAPTHRDALLGRVMSLSYLTRHDEAIASATRMIELGTWHVGDAYYWRAWNRYSLKQLEEAWDDIERATKLLINTSVYTLAGFIAYAREQRDTAINRFDSAYTMDRTNCEAVWTAALIHVELTQWPPAAPKFATARECYLASAADARNQITRLEAATIDATVKARRIGLEQKRIETGEHRSAQAAFNAAQSYIRLEDKPSALRFIDLAIEHPLMREKASTLRAAIEKMPE